MLPGVDAVAAFDWLASRSFTEPLGDGLTLHELVRNALYADLRRRDPERERVLRRLIADHLHERAVARDGSLLSIDLAHLVESEPIRWGYSWEGSAHHRIDDLREGDRGDPRRRLAERGHEGRFSRRGLLRGRATASLRRSRSARTGCAVTTSR